MTLVRPQRILGEGCAVTRRDTNISNLSNHVLSVLSCELSHLDSTIALIESIMFSRARQLCRTQFINRARFLSQNSNVAGVTSAAPTSRHLVQKLEKQSEHGMLQVTWSNSLVTRYPFAYLRDICRCPECFHQSSLQRSFDTVGKLDLNILPEKYEVTPDGDRIVITWPDGHISIFESEWLHSRRLSDRKGSNTERSTLNRDGVEFWNAEKLQDKIPRSDFHEIMEDDLALFEWLKALHGVGIALVTNSPQKVGQAEKLSGRVGHFKTTHYGWVKCYCQQSFNFSVTWKVIYIVLYSNIVASLCHLNPINHLSYYYQLERDEKYLFVNVTEKKRALRQSAVLWH